MKTHTITTSLTLTITLIVLPVILPVRATQPIDVYWNISNPIFSGGYGEDYQNIIEVNKDTLPWEYDQVNIICPSGTNSTERHIIYSVDKEEFETCTIINPKPRIIAVCDQPRNFMYFTITFRWDIGIVELGVSVLIFMNIIIKY